MSTATASRYEIGSTILFDDRGAAREARVIGYEFVDNGRRKPGWWFIVRCPDADTVRVHESSIHFAITENEDH